MKRKEIYSFTIILFTFYLFFLQIWIKLVFHLHFIKGMSVSPTFGRNALEGMESNEHFLIAVPFLPIKLTVELIC